MDYSVFLPDKVDFSTVEKQLSSLPQLYSLVGKVSPDCYDAYARYSCSLAYPKCVTGSNNSMK